MKYCHECGGELPEKVLELRGSIMEFSGDRHRYLTQKSDSGSLQFCNEHCLFRSIQRKQQENGWLTTKVFSSL